MLIRAYVFREDLNKFFHDYHDQYFQLTSKEWNHVEYFIEIVKSFCVYTKILSTTIIFIIHQIFNIYNSLFDHLDKTKARLRKKKVSWKKKLIVAIDFVDEKLREYYNKTQKDLEYLYDKAILLCSLIEDSQFIKAKNWQHDKEEKFWKDRYWDELRANYERYKRIESKNRARNSRNSSFNREESQTLDALVKKEYINFDASFDDEFERYKDQDKSHEFYQSFY